MTLREAQAPALHPRAAHAAEIARRQFGHLSERQREAIFTGIRSKMTDRGGAHAWRWAGVSAGAAIACAVAVGVAAHHRARPEAISFRVEGGELRAGGYVEASASSPQPVLRFSDGSEVALGAGSRAHVRTVDEHGAQVTLDEGKVHAYVVHAQSTHWSFDAGPYVVNVTGTAFEISWAAAENRFDLRLENGSVAVSGPMFDTPVALRAGQWLTVRARDVLIRDLIASKEDPKKAPLDLAPSEVDSASEGTAMGAPGASRPLQEGAEFDEMAPAPSSQVQAPRRAPRHRPAAAALSSGHGWAAELAAGKFAGIVEEALTLGLDATFANADGDDLAALADAARYTRHFDVARGAFLAQRRRFGASERARVAAFSLGRLAEAQQDDRTALSWFETYLDEAPEGTYASEALGRKMLLVGRLDGSDAARPLAAAYLRRFPDGTYSQAARVLAPAP